MEVIHGERVTPLSAVRPCRMDVIPSVAFDVSRSLHQVIFYLLKDE